MISVANDYLDNRHAALLQQVLPLDKVDLIHRRTPFLLMVAVVGTHVVDAAQNVDFPRNNSCMLHRRHQSIPLVAFHRHHKMIRSHQLRSDQHNNVIPLFCEKAFVVLHHNGTLTEVAWRRLLDFFDDYHHTESCDHHCHYLKIAVSSALHHNCGWIPDQDSHPCKD